ncbi:MAG: LamG domain-containing protein [Lentisphaerae bacterium]|jgi:hypothetical protein|nr:LamG domain-containing protein [Lentisphaerota bacterium]MBT4818026.1 LamG domain-containing protein [Lentisphaerota bacterium]MBT5605228.1 LamG domain-containing protein [Lentisphaerota bacterium]MBT7054320.1 LamG domain-containing protein [Lentisphaerota bacterium]MBT7844896.1 LamG domain-containing protein [Lentisphaerota bacterium]
MPIGLHRPKIPFLLTDDQSHWMTGCGRHLYLSVALCCVFALLPPAVFAVDTAFWKPYEADQGTWFLEHFESADGAVEEGRFGKAWRGPEPYVWEGAPVFTGDSASLEAWVRLDRLPGERSYVLRRQAHRGAAHTLELFITADGGLGLAVSNLKGKRSELLSDPGTVKVGQWQHVAGISNEALALFADGCEVGRRLLPSGSARLSTDQAESAAVPLLIGDGLAGLVDEARVHASTAKFWPKPGNPWIARVAEEGLCPVETVLLPDRRPVLCIDFSQGTHPASNVKGIKVVGDSDSVDGVCGRAFTGPLTISGPLVSAEEGTIEFWSRPRGYCNLMDRNRTIVSTNLFTFYFWNSSRGLRPVTLYYYEDVGNGRRQLRAARDALGTEVYSGQWYHYVITWAHGTVSWYVNGRKAGAMKADFAGPGLRSLAFSPKAFGDIDEVYIYDSGLTETEAANTYWRYVDPDKVVPPCRKVADLAFWHLPSSRTLYAQITSTGDSDLSAPVALLIRDVAGIAVVKQEAGFSSGYQRFELPPLDGEYRISVRVGDRETPGLPFKRQCFPWEDSASGITDEVFPPFEPVRATAETVEVVCREYSMNAFGLWDSVRSLTREILAAPVRLVALDEQGRELRWEGSVALASTSPSKATFRAETRCRAIRTETTSTIDVDGMMQVRLRLIPVDDAVGLRRLSLEIPFKETMAELMQEVGHGPRMGYTGLIPPGAGVVWDSRQTVRSPAWLNAFTSYIWLGGAERGLCWFAENDKGWLTAKNHSEGLQSITRKDGVVTLRIDLVNVPGVINRTSEMVFGLQASPTKPLPEDVARKGDTLPSVGLPVHPWGGLSCSWKSPWMNRWEVVDKVIEARAGRPVDAAFFDAFVEQYDPPPVHGIREWRKDIGIFTRRSKPADCPDPVYFEEMAVLPFIPEYHVFQDEWSHGRLADKRYADVDVYRRTGGREINPNAPVNYCRSYQDYALSLMEEWWKRGVSIYWDNTYPRLVTNPWTSAAYETADGNVQPARLYWNMREYHRRTWNLMHAWRRQGVARPLEFVVHMTNANILPFFSWATCSYDMELSQSIYAKTHPEHYTPGEPFSPAYLRATSTGRQVGNYPYLVHDLFQSSLPHDAWGLGDEKTERQRRSWGMRTVHQIISGGVRQFGPWNKTLAAFGYGSDRTRTWLYWGDERAFSVESDLVKGLLLTRAGDRKMCLVLQSWSKPPLETTVTFDPGIIGFTPGSHAYEGIYNRHTTLEGGVLEARLDFPYETQVFLIDNQQPDGDVLFADSFDDWLNPGWDYVSHYAALAEGRLRLGGNEASWRGKPRLFKYLNLPDVREGQLTFTFQLEQLAEKGVGVLEVELGQGLNWSEHGLTHSYLKGELTFMLKVDPQRDWVWEAATRHGRQLGPGVRRMVGPADTDAHRVGITVTGDGHCRLAMDDRDILDLPQPAPVIFSGLSMTVPSDPAKSFGALYLDDIVLKSSSPDHSSSAQAREAAQARSGEVLAAGVDALKCKIVAAFGVFGSSEVYALAMFRRPETDASTVVQRIRSESDAKRLAVLLEVMRELPEREREHVDGMAAIGQRPHRLPEFQRARRTATQALTAWQPRKEAQADRSATLQALEAKD